MTRLKTLAGLGPALALVTASSAVAASVVTTAPLGAFGTNRLSCTATNASAKPVEVMIELVSLGGTVLASPTFTIEPGKGQGAGSAAGPGFGFCRVTGASKSKVRVALCAADSVFTCLAAVPGQ